MPRGVHSSKRGRKASDREPTSIRLSKKEQERLDLIAESRAEAVQQFIASLEWLRDCHEYLEIQAKIFENKDAIELYDRFPFERFAEVVEEGESLGLIEVRDKDGNISALIA